MYLEAPKAQRGLGLISALFLILVVALMVMANTRSVVGAADAFGQDVLAQKALLAAETGAELNLNRIYAPLGSGACGDATWDLSALGIPNCRVETTCVVLLVSGEPLYEVRSTGSCEGGNTLAERRLLVRAR